MEVRLGTEAPSDGSSRTFWWHFAEKLIAMLVSMGLFGAVVSMLFAAFGHANLLHYTALRGLLTAMYMVVGMALWMRYPTSQPDQHD
jgi:hypothetical protein